MMTIQPCECTWHHWILPNMVKTVNCMLCLFYHNFLKFKIQMEYISMTQWLGWFSIPPYFNIIAGKLATSETSQCQRISGDLHLAGSRRDTLLNSSSWMPQILPTGLAKGRRRPFLLEPGTPWWVLNGKQTHHHPILSFYIQSPNDQPGLLRIQLRSQN